MLDGVNPLADLLEDADHGEGWVIWHGPLALGQLLFEGGRQLVGDDRHVSDSHGLECLLVSGCPDAAQLEVVSHFRWQIILVNVVEPPHPNRYVFLLYLHGFHFFGDELFPLGNSLQNVAPQSWMPHFFVAFQLVLD